MLAFIRNLLFIVLPVALPVLLLTGGLIYTGESMPLDMVIRAQASETPVLFRPAYGNRDQQFKRKAVDYRQPQVVMLGSSRVLQFRAQFLNLKPDAFYNAAAPAWRLDEVEKFLRDITHTPDVLILGIDLPWFNANYDGDPIVREPVSDFARIWNINRTVLQDALGGDSFDVEMLLARDEPGGSGGVSLGFRAIRDGHGFRNDGSEQYGDFLVAQHLWQPHVRGRDMGWLADGIEMYTPADAVSDALFEQFVTILDLAQERDMLVVGFLPPYMPSLWANMIEDPRFGYVRELLPRLEALFAERGLPYFDFSDGALLGATDEDFFDGWHPSERIALQAYINMARDVPQLALYSDLAALQEIVNTAPDTFRVFPFVSG